MQSVNDIYIKYIEENINRLDLDKKKELLLYFYNNYDKKYFIDAKNANKLYINQELFKSLQTEDLRSIYNLIQNK